MPPAPRGFEPGRLVDALRDNLRMLALVGLLGMFGGALVARLAVPLSVRAQVQARTPAGAAVAVRSVDDGVLARAGNAAGLTLGVAALRNDVEVRPEGTQQLRITTRASDAETALRLADAAAASLVAQEGARLRNEAAARSRRRTEELARAQAALASAEQALQAGLAREGKPDLLAELERARDERAQLDAQLRAAEGDAQASAARGDVFARASRDKTARGAQLELAQAQRALSALLAEHGEDHPEVSALRARIKRLSARGVLPEASALGQQAEARAAAARAQLLAVRAATATESVAALEAALARVGALVAQRDHAKAQVAALEAARDADALPVPVPEVTGRATIVGVSNRTLRWLATALAPLLAILLAAGIVIVREARNFHVRAASELSHWTGLPVLATSSWPQHEECLEALVDELVDGALDAVGTTLVLPLSELERPLSFTLVAQLNQRAQRQFRSTTGARIAVAQAWEGDLGGARVRRAGEVADRVIWVVAADAYRGPEIAQRSAAVPRKRGAAAILVDAELGRLSQRVGDPKAFWSARSESQAAARSVPPARIPLH